MIEEDNVKENRLLKTDCVLPASARCLTRINYYVYSYYTMTMSKSPEKLHFTFKCMERFLHMI